MFAVFDRTNFPIVKVTFNEGPNSDEEFDDFLNQWIQLYSEMNDFTFLFETMEMKNPHIKYAIKMSQFIKRLKNNDHQYLQKSIILINNNKIKYLLDFIFMIQSPVAPIYIYNISTDNFDIETGLIDMIQNIIDNTNTLTVLPGKSIIPIF
jgi:hypothetical protein